MKHITDIPKHERPREKLFSKDPSSLSDLELLAAILGRGSRNMPVMSLAKKILDIFDANGSVTNTRDLQRIPGIGPAKAALVAAAMEFARRRIRPVGVKIKKAADLLPLVRNYADRKQEYFLCVSLNGASELIATRVVTVGLVNESVVHPREVFADPITDRAAKIVVAHNHPSGSVRPSHGDYQITRRLLKAGDILGIDLTDHIIFTHSEYYSFAENDKL